MTYAISGVNTNLDRSLRKLVRDALGLCLFCGGVPLDEPGVLEVAQEVPKVDVEQLTVLCNHDVVIVPVANAQYERGDAVPSTTAHKVVGNNLFVVVCLRGRHKSTRALVLRGEPKTHTPGSLANR